jgi:hypothetical protein
VTQTPLPEWMATDLDLRNNQLLNARVHNALAPPADPDKGQFWFDTTTNVLKWYDGTKWSSSTSSYGTISDDGTNRPQRARLNFRSTPSLNATVTDESGTNTSSVTLDAKYGPVTSSVVPNTAVSDGAAATLARSDHTHGSPPATGQDTTMVSWWQHGTEQWSQLAPVATFVPDLADDVVGGGWQLSTGGSIFYTGEPIPVAPTGVYRNSVRAAAVGDDTGLSLGWLCYDDDQNLLGQVRCANGVAVRAAAEASGLTARNMVPDPSGEGHTLEASTTRTVTIDFNEGVIGETDAYRTGPNDLGGGLTSANNRQGRYVAGKDSSTGLGNYPPYGGGASWERLGLYDATSVEGWEIPTNISTTTVDFQFTTLPDPDDGFRLLTGSSILDLQYHSANMDDQQDLSIGIMYGYLGTGIPPEIRFYIKGTGDAMTSFEVHTNVVEPDTWYVAKHTIVNQEATLSIIDSLGTTVLSYTHTLPEGWVQVLWLEAYASRLHDATLNPTQWLEVAVDNLSVTWTAAVIEPVIALTGTVTVDDTSVYPWWGNPHDAVVVGGPEGIWSDGSDATYAEVSTAGANGQPTGAGSTGGYNGAWVEMSDLAPEIPADARVESLTFRVRARHVAGQESPYNQGIYVQLYEQTGNTVVAGAGGGNYEEKVPPSTNYPPSWKFPDEFTTQEYTVQAYNIAGATEGGWEAQGWDSQAEMDAYVDARKKKLADTLRAGPVQVVVRGGAPPGDLPGFDAQDTQYDVAEVSLSYTLETASAPSTGWHSETLSGTAAVAAISYATDQFYSGPHSIKAAWPDPDASTAQSNCVIETAAFPPNTPVVLGARVRVPTGSPDVRLEVLGRNTGPVIAAKDQWVYSEVKATTSSDPTLVGFSTASPTNGTSAYIDNVLCREDTGPLPNGRTFFDGDTPDTADTAFVWDGEPENSSSSYYTLEPAWEVVSGFIAIGDGAEPGVGIAAGIEAAVNPLPGTVYFRPFVAVTFGVLAVDTHEVARGQRDQTVLDGLSTGWVEAEGTVSAAKMVTADLAPPDMDPVVPMRIGPVLDPPAQPGDVTPRAYVDRALGLPLGATTTPPQFLWEGLAGAEPTPANLGFPFAAWPMFASWLDTAVPQARPAVLVGTLQTAAGVLPLLGAGVWAAVPDCYRVVTMAPADGVLFAISTSNVNALYNDYVQLRCGVWSDVDQNGLGGSYVGSLADPAFSASSNTTLSRIPATLFSVVPVTAGTRYMIRTEYAHGGGTSSISRDRVIGVYLPGGVRMGANA